jgi:16S rRNA processing protein RimM
VEGGEMSNASDTLIVGKVGAPYGVKGWVKITSYTEEPANIFDYRPWLLEQKAGSKEVKIDQWKTHNKGLVAKFVGIDDRDSADLLKNIEISIASSQLPELAEDEFYWRELVGMKVVTESGYDLGKIEEMFETGANDVMLIKANINDAFGQKQRMVPYLVEQVVKQVNKTERVVTVDWEPGF